VTFRHLDPKLSVSESLIFGENIVIHFKCREMPGSLARQPCPAAGLARQPCPAALPGSLARQPCPAALPGSLARQLSLKILQV
jgi:hypothetical protein